MRSGSAPRWSATTCSPTNSTRGPLAWGLTLAKRPRSTVRVRQLTRWAPRAPGGARGAGWSARQVLDDDRRIVAPLATRVDVDQMPVRTADRVVPGQHVLSVAVYGGRGQGQVVTLTESV